MLYRGPDLIGTINYAAGQSPTLAVQYPSYWQTGLIFRLVVPKTEGGGPVPYEDHLARMITSLSYGKGGVRFLAVGSPDIRTFLWALEQRQKNGWRMGSYTAGAVTEEMIIPCHFGLNPTKYDGTLNEQDDTVAIRPTNGLTIQVGWAVAGALGANITIGAAYLEVYQYGVIPETVSEQPPFRPAWFQTAPQVRAASALGMSENLPIGSRYRATTWTFVNGASPTADNRTDGEAGNAVSAMALSFNLPGKGNDEVFSAPIALLSRLSQMGTQVASDNAAVPGAALVASAPTVAAQHNPGVVRVDWYHRSPRAAKAAANAAYGVDLTDAQTNAVQLNYTVDAAPNTAIYEFHEAYVPQDATSQASG